MGGALHAQHQRVVGIADAVPILAAGDGVGASRQHLVDWIEAAAEQTVLRTVGVERNAERKHLAGTDEARCLDDVLRRHLVERSDVVVLAPAAPVLELFRRLGDRLLADLDVHRSTPVPSPGVYSRGRSEGRRRVRGTLPQMPRNVRGISAPAQPPCRLFRAHYTAAAAKPGVTT